MEEEEGELEFLEDFRKESGIQLDGFAKLCFICVTFKLYLPRF